MLKPLFIVNQHLRHTIPIVDTEIDEVRLLALNIPDTSLRTQALDSIEHKRFHCDGGSVFATRLLGGSAKEHHARVIRFIVAFQTISDYLDNLCDRAHSLDGRHFRHLHTAMFDALGSTKEVSSPPDHFLPQPSEGSQSGAYYYKRGRAQDDGGYLAALVDRCQRATARLPGYDKVKDAAANLLKLYVDLQVYKHIEPQLRVQALQTFHDQHSNIEDELFWWEFAAATGSTLGIFGLVSQAALSDSPEQSDKLLSAYFPAICGLHILLDYLIDEEEDKLGGDLNFCSFYAGADEKEKRLIHMLKRAMAAAGRLSEPHFHTTVVEGLVALYLSDSKGDHISLTPRLLKEAGLRARLIYHTARVWRRSRE